MVTQPSAIPAAGKFSARVQCWMESVFLALGIPLAIWGVPKLISILPVASHGSPEQRFLLWVVEGAVVLWACLVVLWFLLRKCGLSFREIGLWRLGTWPAWAVASPSTRSATGWRCHGSAMPVAAAATASAAWRRSARSNATWPSARRRESGARRSEAMSVP